MSQRVAMSVLLAVSVVLLAAGMAQADPQAGYLVYYDGDLIHYECWSIGSGSFTVIVDAQVSGSVQITPGDPLDIDTDTTGSGSGTVDVSCTAAGTGSVTIQMTEQSTGKVLFVKTIYLSCNGGGQNPASVDSLYTHPTPAPGLSNLGLIILVLLLVATATWVMIRRRGQVAA